MGSSLGLNRVQTRDIKSFGFVPTTDMQYARCTTLIVRVGGMPLPKKGATHYFFTVSRKRSGNQGVGYLQ